MIPIVLPLIIVLSTRFANAEHVQAVTKTVDVYECQSSSVDSGTSTQSDSYHTASTTTSSIDHSKSRSGLHQRTRTSSTTTLGPEYAVYVAGFSYVPNSTENLLTQTSDSLSTATDQTGSNTETINDGTQQTTTTLYGLYFPSLAKTAAVRAGMTTMIDDAVAKCRAGATSVAEALRVTTIR